MTSTAIRAIIVIVWAGSVFAAFQFGRNAENSNPGSGSDGRNSAHAAALTADEDSSAGRPLRPAGAASESSSGTAGTQGGTVGAESDASLPAPGEVDVPELIARMRTQFGSGSAMMFNMSAMLKVMAPIADLSEDQIYEALDEVGATVQDQQQKMIFHQLLLARLAESDGEAAMAYISDNMSDQNQLAANMTMSIMAIWGQREPDRAWDWFMANRDDQPSGRMGDNQLQFIFSGMAAQDVGPAFRRLEELDDFDREKAVSGIAMSAAWNPDSREELLAEAAGQPAALRAKLYQGVFSQWSTSAPQEAIDWARELPEEDRKKIAQQGSWSLIYSHPELGAEFMLENSTAEDLPNTYSNIISNWSSNDPNAAGEWLNSQPQGPELDAARARFAQVVANRDPFSAMEWAKTVEDEKTREQSIRQVFNQWHTRNPQEAEAALDTSGLDEEQIGSIRETAARAAAAKQQ